MKKKNAKAIWKKTASLVLASALGTGLALGGLMHGSFDAPQSVFADTSTPQEWEEFATWAKTYYGLNDAQIAAIQAFAEKQPNGMTVDEAKKFVAATYKLVHHDTGTNTSGSSGSSQTDSGSGAGKADAVKSSLADLMSAMNSWADERIASKIDETASGIQQHTPPSSAVTNLTAARTTMDSVTLSWTKSPATATYILAYWEYGKTDTTQKMDIGNVSTYTVTNLNQSKYVFTVYSANYKADKTPTIANKYAQIVAAPSPLAPSDISVKNAKTGYCSVQIEGLTGIATNTYQSQAVLYDSKGAKLGVYTGNAQGVAISSDKLVENAIYYVQVRGFYQKEDATNAYGDWSEKCYFLTQLSAPKAAQKNKKVTLRWQAVAGASGYTVYVSKKTSGGFKKAATTTGTSIVVSKYGKSKLKSKTAYYFKVRANAVKAGSAYNCDSAVRKVVMK